MIENQDFVFVENAKTLGTVNITEQITGLFTGTRDYFFFFPEKSYLFEQGYSSGTVTNTDYTYDGQPIPKLILAKLSQLETTQEFEDFVVSELQPSIGKLIRVYPLVDISEFKVHAKWLSSGVVARFQNQTYSGMKKLTATPVALKLGSKKKEIKAFYSDHPKYRS